MSLITPWLRNQVIKRRIDNWPRIVPIAHRATPAGAGFGPSRFSSPLDTFKVLYAAGTFPTSFAETIVRDRFEEKKLRFLYKPHLKTFCVTLISSTRDLNLVDLRGDAAYKAGISTDASRARDHGHGQALSVAIHDDVPMAADGIIFDSRLTTGVCVAIYDRAFKDITGEDPVDLMSVAQLATVVTDMGITIRRKRGRKP